MTAIEALALINTLPPHEIDRDTIRTGLMQFQPWRDDGALASRDAEQLSDKP